jgi:hypothetical protein
MAGLFNYIKDQGVYFFTSTTTPAMDVVTRSSDQTFVEMAQTESKKYDLIINGTFNSYNNLSALWGSALPIEEVRPTGPVIKDKKVISSIAGKGKYFISYNEKSYQNGVTEKIYKCGVGALPLEIMSGIGGLGGLIYKGMAHDAQNEYSAKAPTNLNLPLEGDPPLEAMPHLQKRGNAMYKAIESRGNAVGKVAVAFTASAQIIIAVQEDGTNNSH